VVYYDTIMLQSAGTERTAVRFAIDASGTVTDVNSREKSLLQTLRISCSGSSRRRRNWDLDFECTCEK